MKTIRIFLSSTFSNMQEERNMIMKVLYPRMKDVAFRKGIELSIVDLRWGITKEQSEAGKVAEICLKEIDNCSPFFIGILSDKYGWIPKDNYAIIKEYQEVLESYKGRSITDIEMCYGALDRDGAIQASFYMKNNCQCTDTENEKQVFWQKQLSHISNSPFPLSSYNDSENLKELIEKDLMSFFSFFESEKQLTPLEKEITSQNNFYEHILLNFVLTEDYSDKMLNWLDAETQNDKFLLVEGEHGVGKSYTMGYLISVTKSRKPEYDVLYFFVNKGSDKGNFNVFYEVLLHQLKEALKRLIEQVVYLNNDDINFNSVDDIKTLEEIWLIYSHVGKPTAIFIDGIQYFSNIEKQQLQWLPQPTEKLRICISVESYSETSSIVRERGCNLITISPLNEKHRLSVIEEKLKNYSKQPTEVQKKLLLDGDIFNNFLYLSFLIDNISKFGIFEKINDEIIKFTSSSSMSSYCHKIIIELELTFGKETIDDLLSVLAICEDGIEESSLIGICNLSQLKWSEIYYTISPFINNDATGIRIIIKELLRTIQSCFLNRDELKQSYIDRIIAYFKKNITPISWITLNSVCLHTKSYQNLYENATNAHYLICTLKTGDNIDLLQKIWSVLIYKKYVFPDLRKFIKSQNWDKCDKYNTCFMLGDLCKSLKLREQAIEYYDEASDYWTGNIDKAKVYEQLFFMYSETQHENAIEFYNLAIKYYSLCGARCSNRSIDLSLILANEYSMDYNLDKREYYCEHYINNAIEFYKNSYEKNDYKYGELYKKIGVIYHNLAMNSDVSELRVKYRHTSLEYKLMTYAIYKRYHGPHNVFMADICHDIALELSEIGTCEGIIEYRKQALDKEFNANLIYKLKLGVSHVKYIWSIYYIGYLYGELDNHYFALKYYDDSIPQLQNLISDSNPTLAIPFENYARELVLANKIEDAMYYYQKALDIYKNDIHYHSRDIEFVQNQITILQTYIDNTMFFL